MTQINDANPEMPVNTAPDYTDVAEAQAWLTEFADDLATRLQTGVRVPSGSLLNTDGSTTFKVMFSLTPTSSVETQKEDGTVAKPLLYYVGNIGADRKHSSMSGGKQPVLVHPSTPQSVLPALVLRALCDVAWPKVSEPALTKEGTQKTKSDGTPELRWKDPAGKTEFIKVSTLKGKVKEGFSFGRGSIAEALISSSLEKAGPVPLIDLKLWQVQAPKGEDPYKTVMCSGDLERSTKVRHRTYKTTYPQDFVATVDREGNHVPATFYTKRNGKYLNGCCPECGEPFMVAPTKAERDAAKASAKAAETAQLAAEAPPKAA